MKSSRQARRDANQLFRSCLVNGALDESRVRAVVDQIAEARPRGYLDTLATFRRLVRLETAKHSAKIESAIPLSNELQKRVLESLAKAYGAGLSTSFAENPELVGGLRIQVGSDVYDGSIRGRLAALERSF